MKNNRISAGSDQEDKKLRRTNMKHKYMTNMAVNLQSKDEKHAILRNPFLSV